MDELRKEAEEAGLQPMGEIKTRIAFEQLLSRGIGDTIRVSLTVPNDRKPEEIQAGRQILADIAAGRVRTNLLGNSWTSAQLAEERIKAAQGKSP